MNIPEKKVHCPFLNITMIYHCAKKQKNQNKTKQNKLMTLPEENA